MFLALAAAVLLAGLLPAVSLRAARDAVVVLGVLALAAGVWWQRPAVRTGWWLTVAGAALAALANLLLDAPAARLALPGTWGDGLPGAGALLVFSVGLAVLGRLGGRAEAADALDATMIALAVYLVLFALVLHPALLDNQAGVTLATSVPVGGLLLLAMAVRIMLAAGVPTGSLGLLLLAAGTLVAGVVSALAPTLAAGAPRVAPAADPLWATYSLLLGAVGLHPSLARTRLRRRRRRYTLSLRRYALFVALSVAVPLAWVFEILRTSQVGGGPTGFMVPVVVSGLLLLLLVSRLALTARLAEQRADEVSRRSDQLAEAVREQESLQRQLHYRSIHDPLTGLFNRPALLDRMEWVLTRPANSGQHALAVIDLDNFKDINATLGHPAGDELLVAVARRLLAAMPARSSTLARLGADQFAVLLEATPAEAAAAWAEHVRQSLRRPYRIDGNELVVSGSIGLLIARVEGRAAPTPAEALRDADLALHVAKADGKDRVTQFRPELRTAELGFNRLSTDLRRALAEDELVVHYQPVVDLHTRLIVGVEALLRWTPHGAAPVPPAEFIPVAEETGMIGPIGAWVIRQACQDARPWYERRRLTVSVNVSARQLDDPDFATMVSAALRGAGLPGRALVLELTETSLVASATAARAVDQLERLRRDGVRVAIDDFGTGYSSLSSVGRMPVDIVKIDKSFVQRPVAPEGAGAPWEFTRAILQMVEALRLEAIAEGVETAEQAEALRRMRCRLAQGYLFAGPMPRSVVEGLVAGSGALPADPPPPRTGGS